VRAVVERDARVEQELSGPGEAEPHVPVLGRRERRVEPAELPDRVRADERRVDAAALEQRLERVATRFVLHVLEVQPALRQIAVVEDEGVAVDEHDFGVPPQQLDLPLELVAREDVVGIEERDEFAGREA
jgi:hypothetical protein